MSKDGPAGGAERTGGPAAGHPRGSPKTAGCADRSGREALEHPEIGALLTKFLAEELLVAGRKYWTAGGGLDTLRESRRT